MRLKIRPIYQRMGIIPEVAAGLEAAAIIRTQIK
jgi:hypothetical protein